MSPKRIFLTGASGCIGHYIADLLIQQTDHELFLLVRNPDKVKFDYQARPNVHLVTGDMKQIDRLSDLLKTIDVAILTAASWGGAQDTYDINVVKTLRLMNLLDPKRCEQVIYFSTASILDRHNGLLKQAGEIGTDYIKTKYNCYIQLSRLAIAPKITTVYPTLVFGGDATKPYSHLSGGLADVAKWVNLIRFFKADGSFHFIHGADIARVIHQLVEHPPQPTDVRQLVLGADPLTVNRAVEEVCAYFSKPILFRLPLSMQLANFFIVLFRIQMASWDRFCLNYRHFTYQHYVNPSTYNLPMECPTIHALFKASGISQTST